MAGRIRAARCYSGLGQQELAGKLGVSRYTLGNWEKGVKAKPTDQDVERIVYFTKVPAEFMKVGFAPLERPISEVDRRVYELERQAEEAARERQALLAQVGELYALVDTEALERGELPSDEARAPKPSKGAGDGRRRSAK